MQGSIMRILRPFQKYSAFIMLLITIAIVASNPCLRCHAGEIMQICAQTETAMQSEAWETSGDNALGDFKPPKHSFINYETLFGNVAVALNYNPLISDLLFYQILKTSPEVYLDIFIPPQNIA